MKSLLWILCCLCWSCTKSSNITPVEDWFIQKLDNFDTSDTRTWKQRYQYIRDFYQDGRPVFLLIGGDGSLENSKSGFWVENAKEFNAFFFHLEHRFYGQSCTTVDTSVENLKYLNIEQALADLASFILNIPKLYNISSSSKWVTIGGTYAGLLSAQMRLKYPKIVHTAVVSGAPSFLKLEFLGYYDGACLAMKNYNKGCLSEIKKSVHDLKSLLNTPNGPQTISRQFNLCTPMEKNDELENTNFLLSLLEYFITFVLSNEYKFFIQNACSIMLKPSSGTPLDRFTVVFLRVINRKNRKCWDYNSHKKISESILSTSWSNPLREGKMWFYQMCTEIGTFREASPENELFGSVISFDFYDRKCALFYGNSYDKNKLIESIKKINKLNFQKNQSNIIYISGTNDPFHMNSYQKNMKKDSDATMITIGGAGRGDDLLSPSETDSAELKASRELIKRFLRESLREKKFYTKPLTSFANMPQTFENAITIVKKKVIYFITCSNDLVNV